MKGWARSDIVTLRERAARRRDQAHFLEEAVARTATIRRSRSGPANRRIEVERMRGEVVEHAAGSRVLQWAPRRLLVGLAASAPWKTSTPTSAEAPPATIARRAGRPDRTSGCGRR
jgi:hypothetical protein